MMPIPFSAAAALRRAVRYADNGNHRAAFPLLARAARAGIAEAEFRIGRCYLEGAGVPPSRGDGVRWLEKAAARDYVEAQTLVATLCLNGLGPEQTGTPAALFGGKTTTAPDFEAALLWARRAAESGSAEAQAILGYILSSGPEGLRNELVSGQWFRRSAEAGCAQGQLGYALALARDTADPEAQKQAVKYLRAAADQGLATAL